MSWKLGEWREGVKLDVKLTPEWPEGSPYAGRSWMGTKSTTFDGGSKLAQEEILFICPAEPSGVIHQDNLMEAFQSGYAKGIKEGKKQQRKAIWDMLRYE